jgi:hypothetical protein
MTAVNNCTLLGRIGFPVPPNNRLLDHSHMPAILPSDPILNQHLQHTGSSPYGLNLQSPTTEYQINYSRTVTEQCLYLHDRETRTQLVISFLHIFHPSVKN